MSTRRSTHPWYIPPSHPLVGLFELLSSAPFRPYYLCVPLSCHIKLYQQTILNRPFENSPTRNCFFDVLNLEEGCEGGGGDILEDVTTYYQSKVIQPYQFWGRELSFTYGAVNRTDTFSYRHIIFYNEITVVISNFTHTTLRNVSIRCGSICWIGMWHLKLLLSKANKSAATDAVWLLTMKHWANVKTISPLCITVTDDDHKYSLYLLNESRVGTWFFNLTITVHRERMAYKGVILWKVLNLKEKYREKCKIFE